MRERVKAESSGPRQTCCTPSWVRGAANPTNSYLRASFARQRLDQVVRGGSDSIVSDPPQGPPGAVPPAAVGGRLRAPMPPLGVHGHLFSSMPTFFFVRSGSFFLSHGIRHRWMMPKSGSAFVNSRFSSLHENPAKGRREGADPRGHCHRLSGRARTRPLASAIGSARIGQPSTLSDNRWSRCQVSQSSRNRPGSKRFEERDCVREGCAPLSTLSLVVILCSKSFACPPDIA